MELWIREGDYVPDGSGGLVRLAGDDALLQRVLFRLCARRGAFPLLPELGSELYRLGQEKAAGRLSAARQYVAQALAEEPVAVDSVELSPAGQGRMDVTVRLSAQGETLQVTLTI